VLVLPREPQMRNKGWTCNIRQRETSHLIVYTAPIGGERCPIEIIKSDATTTFTTRRAGNEDVRFLNELLAFGIGSTGFVPLHRFCSDKMLLGKKAALPASIIAPSLKEANLVQSV
jgi:hypothetical protein